MKQKKVFFCHLIKSHFVLLLGNVAHCLDLAQILFVGETIVFRLHKVLDGQLAVLVCIAPGKHILDGEIKVKLLGQREHFAHAFRHVGVLGVLKLFCANLPVVICVNVLHKALQSVLAGESARVARVESQRGNGGIFDAVRQPVGGACRNQNCKKENHEMRAGVDLFVYCLKQKPIMMCLSRHLSIVEIWRLAAVNRAMRFEWIVKCNDTFDLVQKILKHFNWTRLPPMDDVITRDTCIYNAFTSFINSKCRTETADQTRSLICLGGCGNAHAWCVTHHASKFTMCVKCFLTRFGTFQSKALVPLDQVIQTHANMLGDWMSVIEIYAEFYANSPHWLPMYEGSEARVLMPMHVIEANVAQQLAQRKRGKRVKR